MNNYIVATGTALAGAFYINEAEEAENQDASAGFYGGFVVEESPSPFHAPLIDRASGFGDIRDGAEGFPEQWPRVEEQPKAYTIEEADAMAEDPPIDTAVIPSKPIMKAKSRKVNKFTRKPRRNVTDLFEAAKPNDGFFSPFNQRCSVH